MHVRIEVTVSACIDGCPLDMLLRSCLEPYGPINPAEGPIIAASFSTIHAVVGRLLAHIDFDLVRRAHMHELGNVVLESIKPALMRRPSHLTIHFHRGVRHHPFEHDPNLHSVPISRHIELPSIGATLVRNERIIVSFVARLSSVVVSTKALLLPARGHDDLCPLPRTTPAIESEIPEHGLLTRFAHAAQRLHLSLGSRCMAGPGGQC